MSKREEAPEKTPIIKKGKFFVLDGTDGAGKHTQLELLEKRFEEIDSCVEEFSFPQYGNPSAYFVENYLKGLYPDHKTMPAHGPSIMFALDRFDAREDIEEALESGSIVLSDRYTSANMGHQGAKITDIHAKKRLLDWIRYMEFEMLGVLKPNLTIILHVPAEIAWRRIEKRGRKRDKHEQSSEHIKESVRTFKLMCDWYRREFVGVDCMDGKRELPEAEIHNKIWKIIKKHL